MKRGLMTIVVAFITILCVNAQEMYIKPMIGGSLSTLTKLDDAKMKIGLVAGGEFGYHFSNPFALTAGLLVTMQGASFKEKKYPKDVLSSLTYLNIPILANYYIVPGLAIKAGIQPGYLLSKARGSYFIPDKDYSNEVGKFDLSIPVGLSYEFSNFVIDARYYLGLGEFKVENKIGAKNSVIMLMVGYKYSF